ncbi:MAG: hypothetical protein AAF721_27235 [Myxococcota bacterium]
MVQVLSWVGMVLVFIEGIALSRGSRWAFALGLPLPWKTETVDVALPEGIAGDLSDPLDRLHAFDLEDYRSAFWLDPAHVGLLYWGVGFGARNTLRIRVLRGLGVVATAVVHMRPLQGRTQFRWRPTIRVAPPTLIALLTGISTVSFGGGFPIAPAVVIWCVMYLALLWWTLRQLPAMFHAVTAQLVARAIEANATAATPSSPERVEGA